MKILIIRFSSFGDVVQCLSLPSAIRMNYPQVQIHMLTSKEYAPLAKEHKQVKKVWGFQRSSGLRGLLKLAKELKQEGFTHIYDVHNNLRSTILRYILLGPKALYSPASLLRPTQRWKRFLHFYLRFNQYTKPYPAQLALLQPLREWGVSSRLPPPPQLFFSKETLKQAKDILTPHLTGQPVVALAPSASYELKRWPMEHWQQLVRRNPQYQFILLGGPEDHFIADIASTATNTVNLSGQLSFEQSSAILSHCDAIVSNDTGLMHVAEQIGLDCIALMGPAPFGYPVRSKTIVKERDLSCRPCSKHGQGPCRNDSFYQECLRDISADEVSKDLRQILKNYIKEA